MQLRTSASQDFVSHKTSLQNINRSSKNLFTITDTRFRHITTLESKNKQLSRKLHDAQSDLDQIDEFRVAMQIDHQPVRSNRSMVFNTRDVQKGALSLDPIPPSTDVNQRRVDILKAQLLKQQRYIRRITTILQTNRKFYEDLKEYLKFFASVLRQSTSSNQQYHIQERDVIFQQVMQAQAVTEKAAKRTSAVVKENEFTLEDSFDRQNAMNKANRITKEKELLDVVDKKQQYISLKNLLHQFKSNEERENFVQTFTMAYSKIVEAERFNVEFKSLFEIQKKYNHPTKIVYKHPIRQFIKQFAGVFPVKSIYHSFPMRDRERFEHLLINLEGMASQIQKDLTKVDTFWLFKSNPFYFQSNKQSSMLELPLQLLDEQIVIEQFLAEPERHRVINLDQKMLSNVETELLQLLDKLIELQTKYQTECSDLQFLKIKSMNELQSNIRKTLESLVCLSSMIGNRNSKKINKIQITNEKESYLYKQQLFCQNDYEQKQKQLSLILGDLGALVNATEVPIVNRAQFALRAIDNDFQIQNMVTTIRENEIVFIRGKLNMLSNDYENVNKFITEAEKTIKIFFSGINNKFTQIYNQYNAMIEQDKFNDPQFRKQYGLQFKKNLKDLSDYIAAHTVMDCMDNTINIMQLQQEFDKKVSSFYIRGETIQKSNESLSKKFM